MGILRATGSFHDRFRLQIQYHGVPWLQIAIQIHFPENEYQVLTYTTDNTTWTAEILPKLHIVQIFPQFYPLGAFLNHIMKK